MRGLGPQHAHFLAPGPGEAGSVPRSLGGVWGRGIKEKRPDVVEGPGHW